MSYYKGLLISTIIHLGFLAGLLLERAPKKVKETMTVEIKHQKPEPKEIHIRPRTGKWEKFIAKSEYFYGIGVTVSEINNTYKILEVHPFYPADDYLKVEDVVLKINGQNISPTNDLRTVDSQILSLTIDRQGVILELSIKTDKIYYRIGDYE